MLQGGLPLVLVRAWFVGGLLSTCGSLTFQLLIAPAHAALRRLTRLSLGMASLGLLAWILLQAGEIASAETAPATFSALAPVLVGTQFGHLVLLQAALLAACAAWFAWCRLRAAMILAAAAVVVQAGHGHGMAMGGFASPLLYVEILHLLAAAAWIGGLLPLLLVVRLAPPHAATAAARRFSRLGAACVAIIAATALLQGTVLVGSLAALRATPYGWLVMTKTALFGILLGFALLNRTRLAPALLGPRPDAARGHLAASILLEAGVGMLTVIAACVLSGLMPGMDMHAGGL